MALTLSKEQSGECEPKGGTNLILQCAIKFWIKFFVEFTEFCTFSVSIFYNSVQRMHSFFIRIHEKFVHQMHTIFFLFFFYFTQLYTFKGSIFTECIQFCTMNALNSFWEHIKCIIFLIESIFLKDPFFTKCTQCSTWMHLKFF